MNRERIYYWDNLKCLLIFLVVLGHILIPVTHDGRGTETVYYFIYLFHMPAFVFVSGFFSKSYMKKDVPVVSKLMGFLILYVIYKILIWGLSGILNGHFPEFNLFVETGTPWYLFAMFVWYLLLPFLAKFKGPVCILATLLFGLYIGYADQIGPFFCLSRIIVFLPFFMAGYYFGKDSVSKLTHWRNRIIAAVILLGIAVGVLMRMDLIKTVEALIYGNRPYSILTKLTSLQAMGARLCLYGIAFAMIFSVMCLVPKRKLPISYIGSRTLSIYIIHRLIRDILTKFDFFNKLEVSGIKLLIVCIVISLIIVWISSAKIFEKISNAVFKIKYKKILATDGGEYE